MKNKLGDSESVKFSSDLQEKNFKRESMAPKIVVCPPVEETVESPMSGSRGSGIFRALSRRLSRRGTDEDSTGSSSGSGSDSDRNEDPSSCSASDSSSDGCERRRRHRSTVSLRRMFQSLSLSSRSQSSSPTERAPKKQPQPKRILRPPVTYTYVRGLSGLPTQRVPRHAVCYATTGLNR